MGTRLVAFAACALLASGCGDGTPKTGTPTTTPTTAATPTTPTHEPAPRRGIDASHHQGPIDWPRVAEAGISFAYLKATEGTTFTDPRFAEHRRAATRAGVDVAGYHYFQLCSDGAAQAEHFLDVLGTPGDLPAALDLELAGSCADPPPAATLLAEVRAFLAVVDRRTGTRTLVYLYPDFEERFGFADDLAGHPQWVRRLGEKEPRRPWAVWQYDDAGAVPGVAGRVDLDLAGESLTTKGR
ncbi:lysozyme [Nocardioides aromaticivorans]|uniref:Lysozyme n=1 Tax=Nocardioides aromaticivorans TaxID=200618 RepID=A0A7Y9ZFZ0_9ACTN|nr:GH25 family lysozyme [Nocardioides aromaticivorans]NYI44697.1 lysozyme [Nocardioides aromaticivorans]